MDVPFHDNQRNDRKIDDRFKQSLMMNQSNNLQRIVSIDLKKNWSMTGRQVEENVEASI